MFHVFGSIAHFERRLIGERTRDGLQAAAAKGRKPGRPQLEEEKLSSALALVQGGLPPGSATRHWPFDSIQETFWKSCLAPYICPFV